MVCVLLGLEFFNQKLFFIGKFNSILFYGQTIIYLPIEGHLFPVLAAQCAMNSFTNFF